MRRKGLQICGLLLCVTAAALLLCKLVGFRITVSEGQDLITDWPATARAGETVTVRTLCVTDGDLKVRVNGGTEAECVQEGVYQFVMPEGDVCLSTRVDTSDYPGA